MAKITEIKPAMPKLPTRKRVAAYARVSMETERLHHSLSAQVSYYSSLIQSNPEWIYAGVYADEGISGTSTEKRAEFQRMLADCEAGHIDIILTKSISRFARNTVDLLNTVRHLRELGIEVRFEKENINSLSGDGEVMPSFSCISFGFIALGLLSDCSVASGDKVPVKYYFEFFSKDHLPSRAYSSPHFAQRLELLHPGPQYLSNEMVSSYTASCIEIRHACDH